MTQEQQAPKPMRIRVKATATKSGHSVEATVENTELIDAEWIERLETQALNTLARVMGKLEADYPAAEAG